MGQISDSTAGNYIHPDHILTFKRVAKRCRVWILVRQYNPASGDYIGVSGYQPKRLFGRDNPGLGDADIAAGTPALLSAANGGAFHRPLHRTRPTAGAYIEFPQA